MIQFLLGLLSGVVLTIVVELLLLFWGAGVAEREMAEQEYRDGWCDD